MTFVRTAVQRTCVAFAFRACRYQRPFIHRQSRLFSTGEDSPFMPPLPPTSKGIPVYPDIDFGYANDITSEAIKRNADPDAVFVVNGSSRGIGLQFIKSLIARTKVRSDFLSNSTVATMKIA